MLQPTLFDTPEKSKQDAIARVETNNQDFVKRAFKILQQLARKRRTFTSMDIWAVYSGPRAKNPRAMGPVFVRGQKAGVISPTNNWVKSGRHSDHNQQLRVWRSNVYREGV
jgi:hypothetical protein